MMATRSGLVKKTELQKYSRPMKGGIIAIKLREDDELVDVVVTKTGDEVVLATAKGMAIRFSEADARPMGRNTSGVKGINLAADDHLVGMVVADPSASLLTACVNGYGKRTLFGPNTPGAGGDVAADAGTDGAEDDALPTAEPESTIDEAEGGEGEETTSSSNRYRIQRRGGKGLRDIKTTARNGEVIGTVGVDDNDEVMMITARGKIQRIAAREISVIGRNTQGVRIMSLDEGDTLAAVVCVPREEGGDVLPPSDSPLAGAPSAEPPSAELPPDAE
jgi:DNA gyrase subunit A